MRRGMMLGRLSSGAESDHGTLVHWVVNKRVKARPCPYNDWGRNISKMSEGVVAEVSLCGRRPGPKSVGWSSSEDSPVNCPKCVKKAGHS